MTFPKTLITISNGRYAVECFSEITGNIWALYKKFRNKIVIVLSEFCFRHLPISKLHYILSVGEIIDIRIY